MTRRHHVWTDDDVQALSTAIKEQQPMLDHYLAQGTKGGWWDAVAGAVFKASGFVVTGKACQRKYADEMKRAANDGSAPNNAWAKIAERVEAYERDLTETMYDDRCGKCKNCLELERVKARVLACVNPSFSHADDDVVKLWNKELKRLSCTGIEYGDPPSFNW